MSKRITAFGLRFSLGVALLVGPWIGTTRAQEARDAKAEVPVVPAAERSETSAGPEAKGNAKSVELTSDVKSFKLSINLIWMVIAISLQLLFVVSGFTLREIGSIPRTTLKGTLGRNLVVCASGMLGFWICGFALMCGGWDPVLVVDDPNVSGKLFGVTLGGKTFELFGYKGFFLAGFADDATIGALFTFQAAFMMISLLIPSETLSGRLRFLPSCAYGLVFSMVLYPVYGCWVWGGGCLADLGANFGLGNGHVDFAGSSVVSMTGGMTALAGSLILGPRINTLNKDGSLNGFPRHHVIKIGLGTLILAFVFNPGLILAGNDSVAVCTFLATAAGGLSSLVSTWAVFGKPDLPMVCNGLLAGAVAIMAPCAFVNPAGAVIIGAVAGMLVIGSLRLVERVLKIGDPVGAVSVFGVNGAFGCLSIGLFATGEYGAGWNGVAKVAPIGLFYGGGSGQLLAEVIGILANALLVFPLASLFFVMLAKTGRNPISANTAS